MRRVFTGIVILIVGEMTIAAILAVDNAGLAKTILVASLSAEGMLAAIGLIFYFFVNHKS